jgi:hypothetical protein
MSKLKQIEIKLVDESGNYSKAIVEYPGYVSMQTEHGINMVVDVLDHMVWEHSNKGKLEVDKPPHVSNEEVDEDSITNLQRYHRFT